jgi:hypothetical protein
MATSTRRTLAGSTDGRSIPTRDISMAKIPLMPPPTPSGPFGGTLGALAIAVGIGVLGAYMLDMHGHTCARCGRRWRHFGAFNFGDEQSHTCTCGQVQWWKCGMPHVLRGSQFVTPTLLPLAERRAPDPAPVFETDFEADTAHAPAVRAVPASTTSLSFRPAALAATTSRSFRRLTR